MKSNAAEIRERPQSLRISVSVALGLVTAWCVWIAASRSFAYVPNGDDIGNWIAVHEWMARGTPLYSGVWDHKDWGFFWVTHPLYLAFGPIGLYLGGLAATLAFGTGVALLVLDSIPWAPSIVLGSLAMATYAASSIYAAAFVPTLAVGITVLALGLLWRLPLISGLLFALASSVKVSGAVLFLAVLASSLVAERMARPESSSKSWQGGRSQRLVAGFIIGVVAILAAALATNQFAGWIEITQFNFEYGQGRGLPSGASWTGAFTQLLFNAQADLQLLVAFQPTVMISLALSATIIMVFWLLTWRGQRRMLADTGMFWKATPVLIAAAAALLLTLAQRPSWHHWGYSVALIIAAIWLLASQMMCAFNRRNKWIATALAIVLAIPLAAAAFDNRSLLPRGAARVMSDGIERSTMGDLGAIFIALPRSKALTIAVFGGNYPRIAFEALPPDTRLACRFFFQFPHMMDRYGVEMDRCVDSEADIVLISTSKDWGDESLRSKIHDRVAREYSACSVQATSHTFWALDASNCPGVESEFQRGRES